MSLRGWVATGLLATGAGLAGLLYAVTQTEPTDLMQAIFLALLSVLLIGLAMSVCAYLNHRLARPNWLRRDPLRLLREGVSVALFGLLCSWLQMERYLSLTIAAVIAGLLVLAEVFFLTRGKG